MWDKLFRVILPGHREAVGGKGRRDQLPFLLASPFLRGDDSFHPLMG